MGEKRLQVISVKLLCVFKLILLLGAGAYILLYLWVVFHRIRYPFELEWIEGGMVDVVRRIVNGQGMYSAPSLEFVSVMYTPVYFYVSALASKLIGVSLFPLRLVSFTASLISFAAIYLIVRKETKNILAAFLSVCLFAASYRITGAWLDVGRVDSLFLAFSLLFIYFIRHQKSYLSILAAGLSASLAILTKQTALVICLPIMGYLLFKDWRHSILLLLSVSFLLGITALVFNQLSNGWYSYYVIDLSQQDWLPVVFASFWINDLLVHIPIVIGFCGFFFFAIYKQSRATFMQWGFILGGALAGALITRAKMGGYDNVLLPAYAVISIVFGLGLNEAFQAIRGSDKGRQAVLGIFLCLGCIFQLACLFYNPSDQIPTKADEEAGRQLIQLLSTTPGKVYLPYHGYLASMAEKDTFAQQSLIWDVMRGKQQTTGKIALTEELTQAIRMQVFDLIILDTDWNYLPGLDQYYQKAGEVFQDQTAFFPVTGWNIRPTFIYVPRQ